MLYGTLESLYGWTALEEGEGDSLLFGALLSTVLYLQRRAMLGSGPMHGRQLKKGRFLPPPCVSIGLTNISPNQRKSPFPIFPKFP